MTWTATEQQNPMNEAKVEITTVDNLADKTMFLSLEFGLFGNFRKADVEAQTDGKQDRFGHTKRLLNSPELDAVRKADTALKMWIDAPHRCWKYGKSGLRIVPLDILNNVYDMCKKHAETDRPNLVKAAKAVYTQQVLQAKIDLGSEFNPKDYVSEEAFESEFTFAFKFLTFGTPEKLKAISPALYEAEKAKNAEFMKSAADEIVASMRLIFHEQVSSLLDALKPDADGKPKRLFSSNVTKLQDFITSFDFRNIGNDADLKIEIDKMKLILSGVDTEMIRNSDNLKAALTQQMEEVKASMSAVVETKGRKIR
jgi:hypothetical protein